jgi:hypothetical protein
MRERSRGPRRSTFIKRISDKRLKANGGKMPFSTIPRSSKPIPQVNVHKQAKRKAGYRKILSGKEYKSARAEALVRAGNRCEWNAADPFGLGSKTDRDPARNCTPRCEMTTDLDAHHLRYPKSRPIAATDLVILCNWHHRAAESQKMHKQGRRTFA